MLCFKCKRRHYHTICDQDTTPGGQRPRVRSLRRDVCWGSQVSCPPADCQGCGLSAGKAQPQSDGPLFWMVGASTSTSRTKSLETCLYQPHTPRVSQSNHLNRVAVHPSCVKWSLYVLLSTKASPCPYQLSAFP